MATDLNDIASELGELARKEAVKMHGIQTRLDELDAIRARRCDLHKKLGAALVEMGHVGGPVMAAAAQKDPPPNPGGP